MFPKAYSPLPQTRLAYWFDLLQKYPLQLDHTYHHGVTFLGIFPGSFDDCMDVLLPRLNTLFQPITFGIFIPNKYSKIIRARAHLKPMTQAKPIHGFGIFRMHNQNAFRGFRLIPSSWAESFQQINKSLDSCKTYPVHHVTGLRRGVPGGVFCISGLASEGVLVVWSCIQTVLLSVSTYYSSVCLHGQTLP